MPPDAPSDRVVGRAPGLPSDAGGDVAPFGDTLDPGDWDEFWALGHRVLDEMVEYLRTVRERPPWRRLPDDLRRLLDEPVPFTGVGPGPAYREFAERVLPYPLGNIHPRFWGWVTGTGTAFGVLAEMMCATMNTNVSGAQSAPVLVEGQVLSWLAQLLRFPSNASGLLVSGGAMANFVGLAAGLHARSGVDVSAAGYVNADRRPVVYASPEAHFSIGRAVRLLGLGQASVHLIPTDEEFRIDLQALGRAIAQDRAAGDRPALIAGNAGTVRTGAFDDLSGLADVAEREGVWLHVDGAFGALVALVPELASATRGLERADSLAVDLHKWLHVPIDAGCVLIRDGEAHRAAFAISGSYVDDLDGGAAVASKRFAELGPQQTRSARGVKLWLLLKCYGVEAFGRMIKKNVEQARHLAGLIRQDDRLELLAPVALNIVCFRYRRRDLSEVALNRLNRRILVALHERGIAIPSHTTIGERFAIRCAITNHRSVADDFHVLARAVRDLGDELAGSSSLKTRNPGRRITQR